MVKKLIKHEFIYYIRTLGVFLPIVLVFGLMARILGLFDHDNIISQIALGSSISLLFVSCAALLILSSITLIVRFYKNMYSAEGYLTFTLPVTNTQHIFVKLFVATVCDTVCLLTVIAAMLIAFLDKDFIEFFSALRGQFPKIGAANAIGFTIEGILLAFSASISNTLLYYACITVGQTAKKNRILMAVGAYFIYYVATQIISTAISVVMTVLSITGAFNGLFEWMEVNFAATMHIILSVSTVISIGLSVAFWLLTQSIMTKKLNLE